MVGVAVFCADSRACLKNRKHRLFAPNGTHVCACGSLCWESSKYDIISCGFRIETAPFGTKIPALLYFQTSPRFALLEKGILHKNLAINPLT
jgi:hypothetical protein